MEATDLCYTPATELAASLRRREVSAVELVDAVLDRIERVDPKVNAFALVLADEAREAASRADEALARGEAPGLLHGIPFSLKDLTQVAGVRTTFGSRAFADNVADRTSVYAERLLGAGGILLGKTTASEFGNKALCDSPLVRRDEQPVEAHARLRRLERGRGSRGRLRARAARARRRHGGVDPRAGELLRRGRAQAFVRPRPLLTRVQPLRDDHPQRPDRAHRSPIAR